MTPRLENIISKAKSGGALKFSEIDYILRKSGYELDRIAGSHHIYIRASKEPISVVKHGKDVRTYTVRAVLRRIERKKNDGK